MSRLSTKRAVFFAGVLAVFGVCLVLHLDRMLRGELAWIPLATQAPASADDYPRVASFWTSAAQDAAGLAVGDAIVAVGDRDLRGLGRLPLVARVYEQADGGLEVPLRYQRAGAPGDAILRLTPIPYPWRKTIFAIALTAVGALLYWRLRGASPAAPFLLATTGYALNWTDFWGGPPAQTYAAVAAFGLGPLIAFPLTLRLLLLVPDELARHDHLARFGPWVFAIAGIALTSWAFGTPLPTSIGLPLNQVVTIAWIAAVLGLFAHRHRRASPRGRRQLRWVLLGFYVGLVPALLGSVATLLEPRLWWLYEALLACTIAIPIGLAMALWRDNLFDVDRLLTAAASYTVISIVLLAGLLGLVPRLSDVLGDQLDPRLTQAGLSLVVAVAAFTGRRRLDGRIGDLFFPERRELQEEAQHLRDDLGRCDKPSEVLEMLGERMRTLLRLTTVAIYARADERVLAPIVAHGPMVAPALDAEGPFFERLAFTRAATRVAGLRREHASPAERALLEAMGVELVLPVVVDGALEAVVCLGEKGSGDPYTATDAALLGSVGARAADVLHRFGERERQREEHEMHARLRRYVPGALAREIREGASLDAGEREISVLFADIRGYTGYAEKLRPAEVFSTVNQYTRAVSALVREHGGSVVEFNGDGMMAVFGAPQELPYKERAAVCAALEIVAAVEGLELETPPRGGALSVGVGVATGAAYVGNIQAVDRLIWTAIGSTTNLAARLQALTRDLDAGVAIDAATYEEAREACTGFAARRSVRIRGRTEPVDVYALPLASASTPSGIEEKRP